VRIVLTILKTNLQQVSNSCVEHTMSLSTLIVIRRNKYLKHSSTCFEILVPQNGTLIQTTLRKKIFYISLAAGKMTGVFCN
jgi:hypothetical protein